MTTRAAIAGPNKIYIAPPPKKMGQQKPPGKCQSQQGSLPVDRSQFVGAYPIASEQPFHTRRLGELRLCEFMGNPRSKHQVTLLLPIRGKPEMAKVLPFGMQKLARSYHFLGLLNPAGRVLTALEVQTAMVKLSSLRVTARYIVSRSNGSRPASIISRTRSDRRIPCGVVAPASW